MFPSQCAVGRCRPAVAATGASACRFFTGSGGCPSRTALVDAPALLTAFGSPDSHAADFAASADARGFEKFVAWTQRQREAGQSFAFGITLKDTDTVVGLFQVRALQPAFDIAEWGFALSGEHWGSGLFMDAAELILDFVFDVVGVHRLEARAALKNGRGNGALQKLGATQEGILQRSFLRNGVYLDQALWTILADESAARRERFRRTIWCTEASGVHSRTWTSASSISIFLRNSSRRNPPPQRGDVAASLHSIGDTAPSSPRRHLRPPARFSRRATSLVVNNTRVFPARLLGRRVPSGGAVECLLIAPHSTRGRQSRTLGKP